MHILRGDSILTSTSMELYWKAKTTRVVIKHIFFWKLPISDTLRIHGLQWILSVEEVSRLRAAIDRRLKSKSRLPVTGAFCTDVFKFLFQGKGRALNNWVLLEERDFNQNYFPAGWDVCLDSHGQGTRIYFPLKIRQFYTMSPKNKQGVPLDTMYLLERMKKESRGVLPYVGYIGMCGPSG